MDQQIRFTKEMNALLRRFQQEQCEAASYASQSDFSHFDGIANQISAASFSLLEQGLIQRVQAWNLFLSDIYGEGAILSAGIVPDQLVFSAKAYSPQCQQLVPPGSVYCQSVMMQLLQEPDGAWYVLKEDSLQLRGIGHALLARALTKQCAPAMLESASVLDSLQLIGQFQKMMDAVNCGGENVVLLSHPDPDARLELVYLAKQAGCLAVEPSALSVVQDVLYCFVNGVEKRVGALYRCIPDALLDPVTFDAESTIGVPGLMAAYRAGNVAILNAPGSGLMNDYLFYYYMPQIISFYLEERPILRSVPTYLPTQKKDRAYVLKNLKNLMLYDSHSGQLVCNGSHLREEQFQKIKSMVQRNPERFLAQEQVFPAPMSYVQGNTIACTRSSCVHAVVLTGEQTRVWQGGVTRFEAQNESGWKDTWIVDTERKTEPK